MSRWFVVGDSQVLAAHAALLRSGHILYFSGSEYNAQQHDASQIDHTRLYDCATGIVLPAPSPGTDLFCCGHALLADGRLCVAGGTERYPIGVDFHHNHWPGAREAWLFDPSAGGWIALPAMNEADVQHWLDGGPGGGRWYPTLVTLEDGNVLAMAGHPSHSDRRHTNNTPEVFHVAQNLWQLRAPLGVESFPGTPAVVPVQYPRLHTAVWGDVFVVTPVDDSARSLLYQPATGGAVPVGQPFDNPDYLDPAIASGLNTASVVLPFSAAAPYRTQVLLCGSVQPLRIDLASPTPAWAPTGPRALNGSPRRYNLNATLLPTGDVLVSGGVAGADLKDSSAVLTAEVYHPDVDQWKVLEDAAVIRNYHSVALLMPDGRVWTAGSNHNHEPSGAGNDTRELRIEIYEPWYIARERPRIDAAPASLGYAQTFDIWTAQAASVRRVALIRTGSSTHAFNPDQRFIELNFEQAGNGRLLATTPGVDSVAPPGIYLLFILDGGGVPSEGCFVELARTAVVATHQNGFAVCPAPGLVEVFWIHPDGRVLTNSRDPRLLGDRWNIPGPVADAAGAADTRSGVAAVCPKAGIVEVFWIRPDGMVFTNARDPNINGGNWNNPIPIAGSRGAADPRSGVAAVSPLPGIVEVFWVRPDGMVFTNARNPAFNGGNWNNPIPIAPAPGSADPRSGVAAVCPALDTVEVFWVRPDGMVFTNARNPAFNGGNWNNPIPIASAPGSADPRCGVTAVSPAPGVVEVFWVRPDGMVFTNARDPNVNGGNWNQPIPIAPAPGSADPRSGVAAVSPAPGIVEVFWVRPDGMVFTNARHPMLNAGNWNNPVPIASAQGAADPRSGIAAVCPAPGFVEVFWTRTDGLLLSNARDPFVNGGNWNNPIAVAEAAASAALRVV